MFVIKCDDFFFSKGFPEHGRWFRMCETDPSHVHLFWGDKSKDVLAISCCNITAARLVISSVLSSSRFLHSPVPGMPTRIAGEMFSCSKANEMLVLYYKE